MKLYFRLLLVAPFVFVSLWYINSHDPDEVCHGLAHFFINIVFYLFLFLTFIVAAMATFFRTKTTNAVAEPISLTTILAFAILLFFHFTFKGHAHGIKWIYAEHTETGLETQSLLLRTNGNFTINVSSADFGCAYSGTYQKQGDTIFLDKVVFSNAGGNFASAYLLKSDRLTALSDTTDKVEFSIRDSR